jgi:hypothetical protein
MPNPVPGFGFPPSFCFLRHGAAVHFGLGKAGAGPWVRPPLVRGPVMLRVDCEPATDFGRGKRISRGRLTALVGRMRESEEYGSVA